MRCLLLTSERAGFRLRKSNKDKKEHHIMKKGTILQEDIAVFNMYGSNSRARIHDAKPHRNAKRNIWTHSHNWRLHCHSIRRAQIFQIENQGGCKLSSTIKQLTLMDIYRLLPSIVELHIPFKFAWNILQIRPHFGP